MTTIPIYTATWGLQEQLFKSLILSDKYLRVFWVGEDKLLIPNDTNPFRLFNNYPTLVWKQKDKTKRLIQCFKSIGGKPRIILKSKLNLDKYISKEELWNSHQGYLQKKVNPITGKTTDYYDLTFDNILWGYPTFWVLDDVEVDQNGMVSKMELYYEMVLGDVIKRC